MNKEGLNIEYNKFAEDMAHRAGNIIRDNFSLNMAKNWKGDNTPVTESDLAINTLLLKGVKDNFPEHSVLSEEESYKINNSEYVWVCDPIDGTIPFSHGIPICTFSLALTRNGESILGVIYDPFADRLFVAEKGKGAFLNNQKIHVSDVDRLKNSVGNCEFWQNSKYKVDKLAVHLSTEEDVKLLKLSSFIYSSVLVAAGELSFGIYPGKYAHDAAAVKIIVEEAGGKMTDVFGNEQRYDEEINGAIVSNGVLHEKLVVLSKEHVAGKSDASDL